LSLLNTKKGVGMKLERLRLYQQELLQEFDGEPINPAIYYFYREGWHLLDGEGKVSLRIVKALNESTRTTQAYFAGRECWFHLELLQATVRINLSGAKGIRQRTKPALLEKLQKC